MNSIAFLLGGAALLFFASCSHTHIEEAAPVIGLEAGNGQVVLTIANEGDRALRITDYGYRDGLRVPPNVFVRVADSSGSVLHNQAQDVNGWWTPRFVDSSVARPAETMILEPSATIERSLNLDELVGGMQWSGQRPVGMCRYQIRAVIFYHGGVASHTSSWTDVDCTVVAPPRT